MTTSAPNIALDNSSTTAFRAWGLAISTALQAVGLVKTADTGQIDFTTVSSPASQGASVGYEMYRFTDALQATSPVFIKIEYGSGSSQQLQAAIYVTVGTSTNGAGTITSALIATRKSLSSGGGTSTTSGPVYFSGDGSYINMFISNATYSMFLSIERTKTPAGVSTGDGVCSMTNSSVGQPTEDVISFLNNTFTTQSLGTFAWPGTGFGSGVSGTDVYYFQHLIHLPKVSYANAMMACFTADTTAFTPVTSSILGTTRTFLPVPSNFISAGFSTLMRYE